MTKPSQFDSIKSISSARTSNISHDHSTSNLILKFNLKKNLSSSSFSKTIPKEINQEISFQYETLEDIQKTMVGHYLTNMKQAEKKLNITKIRKEVYSKVIKRYEVRTPLKFF